MNYSGAQKGYPEECYTPSPYIELRHPDWSMDATIYEVNIRQYTPEGTFRAFGSHLPRLKKMGVDILWLMPVHPIGEVNRKGSLGSYYAVKDYYGINPEFGTMDDFKALVKSIHDLGMHVIIDWVANHSAWDNPLTLMHPGWYSKTREGRFQPTPWYDWDDIVDFDYGQPGIRKYMTEALRYWVEETDIDGYRCDVAGFIPLDFWENARRELDLIKPVFMLAEWESRDLHRKAFDATYSWSFWERMRDAIRDRKGTAGLNEYFAHDVNAYPRAAYRLTFTDNHDKNSWEGGQYAAFGEGLGAAIVLACTVNGIPMIYSGQEAGLDRPLAFFDKDLIEWKDHPNYQLITTLFSLKHRNPALWNGESGGVMEKVPNSESKKVVSFIRRKEDSKVLTLVNLSPDGCHLSLDASSCEGNYRDLFSGSLVMLKGTDPLHLEPWGYMVLEGIENL